MLSRRKPYRRGFLREQGGAAAVEFALVVFPLCFMMFATLEVALYFTVGSVLDNAVVETGRLIRTGQASAQSMTAEQFEARLCSGMSVFSANCAERTTIDVRVVPQFNAVPPDPLADGILSPGEAESYTNGVPGALVVVRVWYAQPLATTFLAKALTRTKDGTFMLTSTTAFRNEPA